MVGDKGKKVEEGEWSLEQLEGELHDLDITKAEASDKVLEIDQTHKETRKPVYDKHNEIIQPSPDFWLTSFLNHPVLGKLLTDEDQKIFKYLDALDVEDSKDVESGYYITFNFQPNPFFEDSKLTKTFAFLDEGTRITATSIKWKEGMGLPNGVAHEKKGNNGPLSGESFFHWFSDAEHKDVTAEIHDEIADIIKQDLWVNSLTFLNIDADKAYGHVGEASDKVLEIHQKHKETRKPVDYKLNEIRQRINYLWRYLFLSPVVLGKHLTDEDQKIFKYLDALDVDPFKNGEWGCFITFNFQPNPFFEDSKLTKAYTFLDGVIRITATSIKWKEGMGLPNGAAREKKGNEGPLSGESFFHWFSDAQHNDVTAEIHDEIADLIMDSWANFNTEPGLFLLDPVIGKLVTDEERKIFEYLKALDVEDSKDVESGYSIIFSFWPNPFFDDSKLTKTFTFLDEGTRITATSIKWKEGMGLPNGATREKKGNKGPLSGESFFHWFSDAEHKDVTADEIADLIVKLSKCIKTNNDDIGARRTLRLLGGGRRNNLFARNYQVSKEETATAYVYKMDMLGLTPDRVRVMIQWGNALLVYGGDEDIKEELPRLKEMRVKKATASMNANGVLTVEIPKRHGPWKWYEYKDLLFAFLFTVEVGFSS